ncbi:hypothetical protein CN907_12750 [Bacillus anthracis]|nr:hypothetical protein CN907_12750 [Bacillus anthracis]
MRKTQVISKIQKELNVLSRNELVLSIDNSELFVRIFNGFTKSNLNTNTNINFCNRLCKPVKIGEIIDYLYY